MAKHKMRCVESENKLDKWLNDKWELKHVYPVYHNYYRRYSLFKNALTNQKPTAITIKKNGVVMITVDRRFGIPNISAKQRRLSRSSEFPKWIRVEMGCDKIDDFFAELGTGILQYL